MDRNRKDNRVPHGLNFLMWSALVRAPWLLGSFGDADQDRRREAERRRKYDK